MRSPGGVRSPGVLVFGGAGLALAVPLPVVAARVWRGWLLCCGESGPLGAVG
ncbi:hypothetical protein [Rhizocola hellebori]|uniref:hypothetical protein n=1 Tax=Rhizocola hellebori TaxID=1392758 RepID=UPI0019453B1E|nr:hypothetical protein [Rhizocola hellebori]